MGTIQQGILGGFSGKVGPVVGFTSNGRSVMRSNPGFIKGKPSNAQLAQRAKLMLIIRFIQPLVELFKESFVNSGHTGFNQAVSYNVRNAVGGVYPTLEINYPMVRIGNGDLPGVESTEISSQTAGMLSCTWTDNSGLGQAKATDRAYAAVYCEELKQWMFRKDVSSRIARGYSLDVPLFTGKTVHTWLGFISANGRLVSVSRYTGPVNVL